MALRIQHDIQQNHMLFLIRILGILLTFRINPSVLHCSKFHAESEYRHGFVVNSIGYFNLSNQRCTFLKNVVFFYVFLSYVSTQERAPPEVVLPLQYTLHPSLHPTMAAKSQFTFPRFIKQEDSYTSNGLRGSWGWLSPTVAICQCWEGIRITVIISACQPAAIADDLFSVIYTPQPLFQSPYVNTQSDATRAHSTTGTGCNF